MEQLFYVILIHSRRLWPKLVRVQRLPTSPFITGTEPPWVTPLLTFPSKENLLPVSACLFSHPVPWMIVSEPTSTRLPSIPGPSRLKAKLLVSFWSIPSAQVQWFHRVSPLPLLQSTIQLKGGCSDTVGTLFPGCGGVVM